MSRWLEQTGGTSGTSYDGRFRALAAAGVDVHGEAAYVAALVAPRARVLDAGCGTGRVAIELARRGYDVSGVDSDDSMLEVARAAAPAISWQRGDLAAADLRGPYDAVVCAGNVVVFLAAGTEPDVVRRLSAALVPGGLLVSGWRTDRLPVAAYDAWTKAAGLEPVARHSTWQGEPWHAGSPWCVAVDRSPGG